MLSKALSAPFQHWVQRARPLPVGLSALTAMWTHLSADCSLGRWPRALTALRMRVLTESVAFVVQITRRISRSKSLSHDGDGDTVVDLGVVVVSVGSGIGVLVLLYQAVAVCILWML